MKIGEIAQLKQTNARVRQALIEHPKEVIDFLRHEVEARVGWPPIHQCENCGWIGKRGEWCFYSPWWGPKGRYYGRCMFCIINRLYLERGWI